ncbi:DUF6056 family protein [Polluticoccus soli]|uniref:DUF6056 family protein n=1 Tax=Polluticoccus soli TaxID=3034150 RepID=UPI0023E2AAB9|nr:DUF6056 family protein [Flavipsychrobacter sp. JY13-12]
MSKLFKGHLGSYFLVALGVLTLLPFLIISLYNNPIAGDDFSLAHIAREMGFLQAQKFWYTSWTGRYFSMALLSVTPLVFGNIFLYKVIPIALLLLLTGALYVLVNALFRNMSFIDKSAIVSVFIFLFLFQLPSTAEGLFWVIGSLTYLLPSIFTIVLFFALVRLEQTNRKIYLLAAAFLCFAIVGSNETSMLLLLYMLLLATGVYFILRRKWNSHLIILTGLSVLFAVIVLLSPGNTARQSVFPNSHNLLYTAMQTIVLSIVYIPKWLPIILLSAIVLYDVLSLNSDSIKSVKVFDVHPALSFLVMLSFPVLCIFPVIWSVGNENAYPRIISLAYFFTLLGFVYFVFTLFFYFRKRNEVKPMVTPFVRVLIILLVVGQVYLPHHTYHPNNIRQAYMDVVSGRAARYNIEAENRFKIIASAQADTCKVPRFKNVSSILYPNEYSVDITTNPKDWRNQSLSNYFGKGPVVLSN